jgi:uncharacterized protein (TIGR00162 family)
MKIEIVEIEKPGELKEPVVISGLPGSGLVGKVAIDHLIHELSAKHFAEVYCDGMSPQIFIESNGTASLNRNDFFYSISKKSVGGRDLVMYTGDSQPATAEAEYELSASIASYVRTNFRAKEIITLGAYVTGNFTETPKVYGSATDLGYARRLADLGVTLMAEGAITGMNGLLLGVAKIQGMRGCSLLGETSGYAADPKASKSVLIELAKLLNFEIDMKALDDRAKEAQSVLRSVESWRAGQQDEQTTGQQDDKRKRLGYIS